MPTAAAAQAQTLINAAKAGVPFCEKCHDLPTLPSADGNRDETGEELSTGENSVTGISGGQPSETIDASERSGTLVATNEKANEAEKKSNSEDEIAMGHVWAQFVSRFGFPIGLVKCKLLGGEGAWPSTPASKNGEVHWKEVPLGEYSIELSLGTRKMLVAVPWIRDKDIPHLQRIMDPTELLGPADFGPAIQVRLTGLGYDCEKADGNLESAATVRSIRQFQRDYSFPVDGRVTDVTAESLVDLFGG